MHKLLVLYNEPKDPAHFRKYYVETHSPLVSRLPGSDSCDAGPSCVSNLSGPAFGWPNALDALVGAVQAE